MDLHELLAEPLAPSIRVRLSPTEHVDIDMAKFETSKEDITKFCKSIPSANGGLSWRLLKTYTGNNGLMAKLLIALGDLAGVWKMHPSPDFPLLWSKSNMYPMVLAGSMLLEAPRGVLKPSRGDLESLRTECEVCGRMVAPRDVRTSPLDCEERDCPYADPPRKEKIVPPPRDNPPEPSLESLDLDTYLSSLNR